ncbi:hypothetical protein GCM10027614_12540 [Micromonospora vulcania]
MAAKIGGRYSAAGATVSSASTPPGRDADTRLKTSYSKEARPARNSAGPPRITASQAGGVCPAGSCSTSSKPEAVVTTPAIINRWVYGALNRNLLGESAALMALGSSSPDLCT